MWKTITSITLILMTVCVSVLFFQWNEYTTHVDASSNLNDKIKQEIVVKTLEKGLMIEQKVTGLTIGTVYNYTIPSGTLNFVCTNESNTCQQVTPNSIKTTSDTIVLSYELEMDTYLEWLKEDWVVKFANANVIESKVEIIDQYKRYGTFIIGSLLQGAISKEIIDYYVFHGFSNVGSLYFYPEILNHKRITSSNDLYYLDENPLENISLDILKQYKEAPYVSLVATSSENENVDGILFIPSSVTEVAFNKAVLSNYYKQIYNAKEDWLTDLVLSEKLNLEFDTSLAKKISSVLQSYMGEEKYNQLIDALHSNELEWDAKKIDQYITSMTDYRTFVIEDNINNVDNFTPMELYEKKTVRINNELMNQIRVKIIDNKKYFPLTETLSSLGYTVEYDRTDQTINVVQDGEVFKFYTENALFIFNDRRYALKEPALTFINGKSYISKEWIKALFAVSSNELEDEIVLFKK